MFLETMKDRAAHLEVRARSIKQIWFWRFSKQVIERNIKNSPEFYLHTSNDRKKHIPASEEITATSSMAQFSVTFSKTEGASFHLAHSA